MRILTSKAGLQYVDIYIMSEHKYHLKVCWPTGGPKPDKGLLDSQIGGKFPIHYGANTFWILEI